MDRHNRDATKLTVVIPCYNEEMTLSKCVKRVIEIKDAFLELEVIIIDDCSTDRSFLMATELASNHPEISVIRHKKNQGKGAALRTGFQKASGDFVAVQDADLEYNPMEMKKLLVPLINNEADVVFGSRFLSSGAHRVLYFWHYLGNRFLTLLSNMLTDLNLTDMETCYKVFRREIIQSIDIKENRFGFEPEIVAKIAHKRLRIYEMGISYYGRTYEEGKKIGVKDGIRAMYCIFRYNLNTAPLPIQFVVYMFIGGLAAVFNLLLFLGLITADVDVTFAAPIAFMLAAVLNYLLCITLLFRHRARWNSIWEIIIYWLAVGPVCLIDLSITKSLISIGFTPLIAKIWASGIDLVFNFIGRRFLVFPEASRGTWKPQTVFERNKTVDHEKNP